jgi:hypothetical protein
MNAITDFFDAANVGITDAAGFLAADEATQNRILAAWRAHDAQTAARFADRIQDFYHDAQVGYAFLTPQLYRIETEVYRTKRPSFDFAQFMPVNSDGDMWDIGTVFYSMDEVGKAEFLSGKSFDMPYADTLRAQHSHAFHLAGIGYEWSTQELQRAAKLGRSLTSDKAMSADSIAQAFLYSIAMTGRAPGAATAEKGWTGFVNNGSAPAAQVAADGTAGSRLWTAKTPDLILRDINDAINAVETGTGETYVATDLVLPTSRYNYIANTRLTDTGTSILAFLRANNSAGEALTIRRSRALETAGTGSTTRMIAYAKTPEVLRFHLPGPHQFLPAFQKSSMVYEVGGIMNVGGTEIRQPKAVVYRDSF